LRVGWCFVGFKAAYCLPADVPSPPLFGQTCAVIKPADSFEIGSTAGDCLAKCAAEGLCMHRRLWSRFFLIAVFVAGLAQNAAAHPHVWVSARAQVIFDAKGEIEAIRHAWTFDEMYSAFVTEGQGRDGQLMTKEELAPLAKTNVESLAEFDFFTYAKVANAKIEFGTPIDYSLEQREDKLVVLRFTLPLKSPASAAKAFPPSL
jgi:ABC-type uncharacterized transport system substrate-binding protein